MAKPKAQAPRGGGAESAVGRDAACRPSLAQGPDTGEHAVKPKKRRSAAESRATSRDRAADGDSIPASKHALDADGASRSPATGAGAEPCASTEPPAGASVSPQHRALIAASAITPAVAAARGYRTVETKVELEGLGFAKNQCRVPSLLIPVHNVHGVVALYQSRPELPRIRNGKPLKYETPHGARMILDVPPTVRASGDLRHGAKPLFITEGIRKADAGASAGLCIVDLLGVWNWRGTNELGGKTALADWEHIHVQDRAVFIVFDSDVSTNPAVAAAMARLKAMLEGRKANVSVIYLPPAANGEKQGLDDFFAAGGSVETLMTLASKDVREPPKEESIPIDANYYVKDGSTYMLRSTPDGPVSILLGNFTATITGDLEVDDGVETHGEFEILATIGDQSRKRAITVAEFHSMTWPSEMLGATAAVGPGLGIRDQLRFAVQVLGPAVARRRVYAHMGWRHIPGVGHCYLHAGGAHGPEGPVPDVETRLPEALSLFVLPTPRSKGEIVQATARTLDLLNLGPPRIMYPLAGLAFRASIGDCDLSGFLSGNTGGFKTATAAIWQSFFAPTITAKSLPCSWSGTANSLEVIAFHAKDTLLVVDDFKPVGSPNDVARKHAQADQLLRAQGNRLGRSRLRPDATPRPARPPRGLILSTGEDLPFGASLNARMVVLDVQPGDINVAELTRCQADAAAGVYALAMAGFIQFLAKDLPGRVKRFRARVEQLRAASDGSGGHRRATSNLADLQAAWEMFLAHAQEIGAIDAQRAERERRASWDALLDLGERQAEQQTQLDEVEMFFRLLTAGLASGAAHLADRSGSAPTTASPAVCGWRRSDEGPTAPWREQGMRIGWIDGAYIYLIPEAAIGAAQRMGTDTERLTSTKRTLVTRMAEAGRLARQDTGRNKHCVRVEIGESRVYALCIEASLLLGRAPGAHEARTRSGEIGNAGQWPETRAQNEDGDVVSGPAFGPTAMPASTNGPEGPKGPDPQQESHQGGASNTRDERADSAGEEGEWKL